MGQRNKADFPSRNGVGESCNPFQGMCLEGVSDGDLL